MAQAPIPHVVRKPASVPCRDPGRLACSRSPPVFASAVFSTLQANTSSPGTAAPSLCTVSSPLHWTSRSFLPKASLMRSVCEWRLLTQGSGNTEGLQQNAGSAWIPGILWFPRPHRSVYPLLFPKVLLSVLFVFFQEPGKGLPQPLS